MSIHQWQEQPTLRKQQENTITLFGVIITVIFPPIIYTIFRLRRLFVVQEITYCPYLIFSAKQIGGFSAKVIPYSI